MIEHKPDGWWGLHNDPGYDEVKIGSTIQAQALRVCTPYFKHGNTCLDIGANVGCWSRHMAEHGMTVYAIEPEPEAFACLYHNTQGLSCHPLNVAIGHPVGLSIFYRNHGNRGSNCLRPLDAGSSHLEPIVVPVMTIDVICDNLATISFIKIDIEGGEIEALQSGRSTISRTRPVMFIEAFERGRSFAGGKSTEDLQALIKDMGYTFQWECGSHDLLCLPDQ